MIGSSERVCRNGICEHASQWHISSMTRAASSRLQRLEELRGLLGAREHVTVAELAEELGVSLRTVHRDLGVLRDLGVPIESERGRGGGLRIHRAWAMGRMHLNAAEAVDLLLSLAIAERMGSPLLLTTLASIRRKVVAAFGADHRTRIRGLRRRILVGRPASRQVTASFVPPGARALAGVAEAFVEMRTLTITYRDQRGRVSARDVEPHFLYLNAPVWYLLTWDRLRQAVRTFRADRISSITVLATRFQLAEPAPFLADVETGIAGL
jgi:predicted DNA-binding transcriptional regulator YafY